MKGGRTELKNFVRILLNNKAKRILSLASAIAIMGTSVPVNVLADSLDLGPEIGINNSVSSTNPRVIHKWNKYNLKHEYVLNYIVTLVS